MKKYLFSVIMCLAAAGGLRGQNLFPQVTPPVLPDKLSFAGEAVPLDNYDTRESLQRELAVSMFMHSRTLYALMATKRYFAVIEPILKKNGIPADFKYLCMAESGLNPNISSGVGAAGLWQLMPSVGKSYGMEVGKDIDERYDIEKSTEAACRHLRTSYEKLGSWTLAAAAYNLGLTGVSTRLQKQGVENYYDAFLPEETLRYMFRILSLKAITEHPMRYGYLIPEKDFYVPLPQYREATVSGRNIDWAAFAREQGTTYKMLRELNHWIRDYDSPNPSGKTYTVRIPLDGERKR